MSKKDKKLKKKNKGKKEQVLTVMSQHPTQHPFIKIEDENLSLEERIYAVPFTLSYDFNQNRNYQLEKSGLLKKYEKQMILTTYEGGFYDNDREFSNYVGKITDEIRSKFLNKNRVTISKRSTVEYSPNMLQYVGVSIVTSDNYVLLLESIEGRLKDKYTMVQGHVDYDSSFMYTELEAFIAKNTFRELMEEVKFEDGTTLPLENMDKEASFIINKSETLIDLEHIGFVYQYKLSDEDILKVVSAEPEKHNVVVIPKSEIENEENIEKYDSWLSSIAPHIK